MWQLETPELSFYTVVRSRLPGAPARDEATRRRGSGVAFGAYSVTAGCGHVDRRFIDDGLNWSNSRRTAERPPNANGREL
ncbi:hypothetical protein EVAR_7046_1 [Eumeta japonica]|uniref:Uncharacterized protein n=1 Tax=Eumeta variegata TaxID=151549 RepID=A0A4C1YL16_EUMVA|nr:hypothetical protein EVAR_7046_1 [Eumeta japonica]